MGSRFRLSEIPPRAFAAHALVVICLLATAPQIQGCPPSSFCQTPSTLASEYHSADVALLAEFVSGVPNAGNAGTMTLMVYQFGKGPGGYPRGREISLEFYRKAKPGDLFLVLGNLVAEGTGINWHRAIPASAAMFDYVVQTPSPEIDFDRRLPFFIKHLESTDPLIASDAYLEFQEAPFPQIAVLSSQLPRKLLGEWIVDPETNPTRLELYGKLLGLCGNDADAELLEKVILKPTDDFRVGISGVITGYLLLRGERGLDVIDEHNLRNKTIPFSETFGALEALRFMWSHGGDQISAERLRMSMRILLDRPELADLAIADLGRWKDWSVRERLLVMFDQPEFQARPIKRAIVRYMMVSGKIRSPEEQGSAASVAQQARESLALLRKKDPKTVAEAARFFAVP